MEPERIKVMRFAENNRISHRQLFRQIILVFPAPFLLCLFKNGAMLGISAMAGTAAAAVVLSFYVIWLIRLTPAYGELSKRTGSFTVRFIGLFFLVYVIASSAFLSGLLGEVIPESLISGISGKWLSLLAVAACSLGTHRGMQRRGRIAEVAGRIFLAGILLLMLLCAGQGKTEYFMEVMKDPETGFTGERWFRDLYTLLCAFSGAGLLPFGLEYAKKQGSARKPVILAFLTVCGIIFGMQLLLPAVFGGARLKNEICPVLPLLEGADLPGNVLARFDVIWMGFLVFGLLFSLGSLFHYGNQIAEKTGFGTGRYWIPAAGWLLSLYERNGMGIREYYGWYLGYIFVPFLLVIQLFLSTENRGEKSNCGRTCPGHHFDGIRLCGSRTGKKSLSAGIGGRCFREWLCAEICNAGYEYSYRTGKTGRRSDFCADSFRPGFSGDRGSLQPVSGKISGSGSS